MKCKDCAKYDWQSGWCQSVHDSPDEERERDCKFYYPDVKALSVRIEALEKLVAVYQDELIPGYRERAVRAERERDAAVEQLRASKNTQWPTCWSAYY